MAQKGTLWYERFDVQSLSLISVAECVVYDASSTKVGFDSYRDHMHTDKTNECMHVC